MARNSLPLLVGLAGLLAVRGGWAQGVCLPVEDPASSSATVAEGDGAADAERLDITAGRIRIGGGGAAQFSEQVQVRFMDALLSAERASYRRDRSTLEFAGRVEYTGPEVTVFGEDARVDTQAEEVFFGRAGFELPARPARGTAERVLIRRPDTVSLSDVSFTTCPADDVDWELVASEISLDPEEGFGTARGVKLRFKGVPILYAPYFTFPIDDQRKSGFLTPTFAERDRTGLDVGIPYYLNLAPNYDLTVEPRYLSKRGLQVNSLFRYLLPRSAGTFDFEYLPDDDELNRDRSYINLEHRTAFGDGWLLLAGIEEISDDRYFEDLGDSLSITSQTHLNRFLDLGYFAPRWRLLTRLQNYQTIDPRIAPEQEPYERLPQMRFEGRWSSGGAGRLELDSAAELVNFDRDVGTTGWRFDTEQELSLQLARAGMYLTPAIALRQTSYWLDETAGGGTGGAAGGDETLSRTLPVASVDAGLRLEREAGRHGGWLQTLEPRMRYVRIPFEEQSEIPVFDTILPDFNLVQLFRKYRYIGPDRIANTEQLSFGITTRLIGAETGREQLAATLGQTRYLTSTRVGLPGQPASDASASDYVAELVVGLSQRWNLDVGYQWNDTTESTARAETRFEYRPSEDRLLGLGYRYRHGLLEQGDVSFVWPVGDRWRLIGRYSYSLLEEEPLEQFVGWEYEDCCWRLRLVSRSYVSRRTGETDNAISVQLELKGLTQRARAPEELLDRGILGYRRFDGAN